MRKYIKQIQQRSIEGRKQIFVITMIVLMSLVFIVWIFGLGYRFSSNNKKNIKEKETIQPFTILKNTFVDTYKNINESFLNIPKIKIDETKQEVNDDTSSQNNINLINVEN